MRRSISDASVRRAPRRRSLAELSERRRDVCQSGVCVHERRDLRAAQLASDVGLAAIDDDQIRPQREDAFDIRIEQRADPRGRRSTSGGKWSKLLTPTSWLPTPTAKAFP